MIRRAMLLCALATATVLLASGTALATSCSINNGAQFTGTTNVDPAQLDRFAPLKLTYPPASEEVRILAERYPLVSRGDIDRVVKVANAVRADKDLRAQLSVRATQEVCLLLGHPNFEDFEGDAVVELIKTSFCGRFAGSWDDVTTDAGLVWEVVVRSLNL